MFLAAPGWLLLIPLWALVLWWRTRQDARTPRVARDFVLWQRAAAMLAPPRATSAPRARDLWWLAPLVLLTVAAAGPGFAPTWRGETVVILDRSASMGVVDGGTTRIARGMAIARELIGGDPTRVVGVPAPSLADLERRASGATVTADDLWGAAAAWVERATVVVVTDLPLQVADLPAGAGLVVVSDAARNAGITACGIRPGSGLLVRVGGDPGTAACELVVRERPAGREVARARVADPSSFRVVLPEPAASAEGWHVALEPADALTLDDAVDLVGAAAPIDVAIAGEGLANLARAFAACPAARVTRGALADADLLVGARGSRASLLVGPLDGSVGPVARESTAVHGRGRGRGAWEGFDLEVDDWPRVWRLAAPASEFEVLLAVDDVPLLLRHDATWLLLADPEVGIWAARPSFPLLAKRLLDAIAARSDVAVVRRAGEVRGVPSPGSPRARWTEPDGTSSLELSAGGDGRFVVLADQPGVGRLVVSGRPPIEVASGVLSDDESRVARAGPGLRVPPATSVHRAAPIDLAGWCALAAGLVMMVLLWRPILRRSRSQRSP